MLIRDLLSSKSNSQIHSIEPGLPLTEAVARMVRENIGSLVVMDAGKLAGIITERDIVRGFNRVGCSLAEGKVVDAMNASPTVAVLDDTVDYMRGVLSDTHSTHLIVKDKDAVVGVVSFHDIARGALSACNFENLLMKRYIKDWHEQT
jgi:CBS domain-containing protein